MSEAITIRVAYDRTLWRRSMSGWWQSVVPPEPFPVRAITWAVIWGAIGILAMLITAAGLTPYYVVAGLIGAGCLLAGFGYLQRTRMNRFWDVIGSHWDNVGMTEAVFGPEGIVLTDAVSRRELSWDAIDAVKGVRGATVFRTGFSMFTVPDRDLPEGMTGKALRQKLGQWGAPLV
mgnify:FL=1